MYNHTMCFFNVTSTCLFSVTTWFIQTLSFKFSLSFWNFYCCCTFLARMMENVLQHVDVSSASDAPSCLLLLTTFLSPPKGPEEKTSRIIFFYFCLRSSSEAQVSRVLFYVLFYKLPQPERRSRGENRPAAVRGENWRGFWNCIIQTSSRLGGLGGARGGCAGVTGEQPQSSDGLWQWLLSSLHPNFF